MRGTVPATDYRLSGASTECLPSLLTQAPSSNLPSLHRALTEFSCECAVVFATLADINDVWR